MNVMLQYIFTKKVAILPIVKMYNSIVMYDYGWWIMKNNMIWEQYIDIIYVLTGCINLKLLFFVSELGYIQNQKSIKWFIHFDYWQYCHLLGMLDFVFGFWKTKLKPEKVETQNGEMISILPLRCRNLEFLLFRLCVFAFTISRFNFVFQNPKAKSNIL